MKGVQNRIQRDVSIRKDYKEGVSTSDLATKWDMSVSRVLQICEGIRDVKADRQARYDVIRQDYQSGMSVTAIAKKYGTTTGRICQLCKDLRESVSVDHTERNADIRKRFASGETVAVLADEYGLSRAQIYTIAGRKPTQIDRTQEYGESPWYTGPLVSPEARAFLYAPRII